MKVSLGYAKAGHPVTLPGWLSLMGFFLGVCSLAAIVTTAVDTYRESQRSKWPRVGATITQQSIQQTFVGRYRTRAAWYIQSEVRYNIDAQELTAIINSRTGSTQQRAAMRRWISQHPAGTSLPIRYDPQRHNIVVPETGDMPGTGPQSPDDRKMILIFLLPSVALLIIGQFARSKRASNC